MPPAIPVEEMPTGRVLRLCLATVIPSIAPIHPPLILNERRLVFELWKERRSMDPNPLELFPNLPFCATWHHIHIQEPPISLRLSVSST